MVAYRQIASFKIIKLFHLSFLGCKYLLGLAKFGVNELYDVLCQVLRWYYSEVLPFWEEAVGNVALCLNICFWLFSANLFHTYFWHMYRDVLINSCLYISETVWHKSKCHHFIFWDFWSICVTSYKVFFSV